MTDQEQKAAWPGDRDDSAREGLATFHAMHYDGTLDSYWRILQWMKDCGDTNALANEVTFRTPIITWPSPLGSKAANPGDWIIKLGGQGFGVMVPR